MATLSRQPVGGGAWKLQHKNAVQAPYDDEDKLGSKRGPRKNTKKWCKGKVGVLHVEGPWENISVIGNSVYSRKSCVNCSKELEVKYVQKTAKTFPG
jgi:hypothetical protein